MQNSILHVTEDQADVLCVDSSGEVVVQGLLLLVLAFVMETLPGIFGRLLSSGDPLQILRNSL